MNKKGILMLVLIVFNVFLIVPRSLAVEIWVDGGTYTLVRQIDRGSDDVFAIEDYNLWKGYILMPIKYTWGDMRIGLRFNNVTIANATETYRERIVGGTLSFYCNSSMPEAPSGGIMATLYPIFETNPSTFTTFEDFMDRPIANSGRQGFDFADMTSESGEWFNYSGLEHILRTQINGMNHNVDDTSIAFKIYSASGQPNRYFRTYDYNPNYGAKLYLEVQKLHLVDSSEEGWFYDEYRGIDIWQEEREPYENFTFWNEHDIRNDIAISTDGEKIEFKDYGYESWNRDMAPYGYSSMISKTLNDTYTTFETRFSFKINASDIIGHSFMFAFLGVNNTLGDADRIYTWFDYATEFNQFKPDAGGGYDAWYMTKDNVAWVRQLYDGDINYLWVWIQNYEPINWDSGYDYYESYNVTDFTFNEIYAMVSSTEGGPPSYGGWVSGYMENVLISLNGSAISLTDSYYAVLTDENGTTTIISPVFDTPEEVEEWIDDYLFRTGEDDKLDAWGDTILALMGASGFIMMPLSFYLFMANYSTDLDNAFYLLMVVFVMGLAFFITWLWA